MNIQVTPPEVRFGRKKKVGQQLIMYTLTQLSKLNYITLKEECAKGDDFMAHISVIYSRQIWQLDNSSDHLWIANLVWLKSSMHIYLNKVLFAFL